MSLELLHRSNKLENFGFYTIEYALMFSANKTGAILDDFTADFTESSYELKVETMSLELLHRSNEVENYGFYTFEYSLLITIGASIMNNLITAIQFEAMNYW
ncbi:uncharacterized protein LOC129757022 [Uranotaenia lowii]|uniref:uncharacterized protein LOC129757022 n=1 Tax=Uranotaenia lowii TaxID=190385 RepID=UPI00247A7CA6|nr:uncharacterized protein LOC129757022 [Uranotaenia lowii]